MKFFFVDQCEINKIFEKEVKNCALQINLTHLNYAHLNFNERGDYELCRQPASYKPLDICLYFYQ